MTESRAAQAMPVQSARPADPTEPRTLADAMERTVPLLFGGFSRASPVRMVCFNIHTSPLWGAFFILVNLASCAFISMMPEVPRAAAARGSTPPPRAFGAPICIPGARCRPRSARLQPSSRLPP